MNALKENDPESNLGGFSATASNQLTAFERRFSRCKKLKQHITKPQGQAAFDIQQSSLTFPPSWLLYRLHSWLCANLSSCFYRSVSLSSFFFFSQQSFMAVGTVHLVIEVKPQNLHCVVSKTLMLKIIFVSSTSSESKAFFFFFFPNTDSLKIVKCTNKHPSQNRQTYLVFFFFFFSHFLFFDLCFS